MRNLWNAKKAVKIKGDPLALRVYTSRLLGQDPQLVLHGGGNTSVKMKVKNLFGEAEDILYVKGSGWDLATIEKEGFAPVRLDVLKKMAALPALTDSDMVRWQRSAMLNPSAPNPSVEAILHAIIPYRFVDHTHADSVVAISNTKDGLKRVTDIYGKRVLVVPYVMPGFILAKKIYELTKRLNWGTIDGIILLNHGVFTFHDDARQSYGNMIKLVTLAEQYLKKKKTLVSYPRQVAKEDLLALAQLRREVSLIRKAPMLARVANDAKQVGFSARRNVRSIATRGPLTPDHVIRTKIKPVVLNANIAQSVMSYARQYQAYFNKYKNRSVTCLDLAPRWAVWPGYGTVAFGASVQDMDIVRDITNHTIDAIGSAERLGGWKALPERDLFEMEYWELEQAKLKKSKGGLAFQGKIVLVTGAASGIGRACVEQFLALGACVTGLDINPLIKEVSAKKEYLGIACDITRQSDIVKAVNQTVRQFGGLDVVVSNAGNFPPSESIEKLNTSTWSKSLDINLTSHQQLLQASIPYLRRGMDPSFMIIASKNVPAPGPGVAAYSVAKAGLTQLGRVAALELASTGIRVNMVHPNAVFDTAIWTKDVLAKRAKHYGLSVDAYKKNNLLNVEIASRDVAALVSVVAGQAFSKTTGAQIPIDGGNDRVI